ncbi:hypothetical protein [Sphingosinicella humi]|nr:hypothetical protein [Sphingosinicella humi]
MFMQKGFFAFVASLMTMIAFSGTVAVMTVDGGAGFPDRGPGRYQAA